MKTLLTLALASMMVAPAFAASETENVKDVTDVYIAQHNSTIQDKMNKEIKQDILFAINNFKVRFDKQAPTLVAINNQELAENEDQLNIE